jgi:hypothetical protein
MYADGNNYVRFPHSYEVSIKLLASDKIILEKFRDLLSPNTEIKIVKDNSTPNLHYKFKISEQLSILGCIPNKSLILTFLNENIVPTNLINHFVRGYSDGDGSICSKKPTKTGYVNYAWAIISTNNFCDNISNLLQQKLNVHSTKYLSRPKINKITTTLSVGGNLQVKKVLDWLYQDATVYLPRKYDKYQEFITYFSELHL